MTLMISSQGIGSIVSRLSFASPCSVCFSPYVFAFSVRSASISTRFFFFVFSFDLPELPRFQYFFSTIVSLTFQRSRLPSWRMPSPYIQASLYVVIVTLSTFSTPACLAGDIGGGGGGLGSPRPPPQ